MDKDATAAQMHAAQKERQELIGRIASEMRLRQWAVEQAVKCAPGMAAELTEFFYDFVTKP